MILKQISGQIQRNSLRFKKGKTMIFWVIAKRELKAWFVSPIAYVILGIFALLSGIYYSFSMQRFDAILQNAEMQARLMQNPEVLNYININSLLINNVTSFTFMLLLFASPFFTMRLFSEERINSTYELLMTSPISIWDIVLGKYVAAAIFYLIALSTHILFLLAMFGFGNPEIGPVFSSYLGLFLAGLAFGAIGCFTSSLTKHQIIAVFLAFAINLVFLMISWGAENAFGNLATFLNNASISTHFENFNQGIIFVSSSVYFLSIIVLFLSATQISVKSLARS